MRLAATVENYKRKNVENKKAYEGTAQLAVLRSFADVLDAFSALPNPSPPLPPPPTPQTPCPAPPTAGLLITDS